MGGRVVLRPVGSPISPVYVADQENHAMPQILKVLHLAQQHGVAQVQIGRRRIEAGLHAQRTAGLLGLDQALAQVFFADQVGQPFLEVRQLFVNCHCLWGHCLY